MIAYSTPVKSTLLLPTSELGAMWSSLLPTDIYRSVAPLGVRKFSRKRNYLLILLAKMDKKPGKCASTSSTNPTTKKKAVIKPLNENIFASLWKDSDTILIVGNTEFHVHRTILTMHSPVFQAMLSGNFKEANLEKIELPGKVPDEMLQFLKILYPECMIRTPKMDFATGEDIVFSFLQIADEYQTEELLRNCLAKIRIRSANVFEVLPYANKYNFQVREKCVQYVVEYIPMNLFQEKYTKLEATLRQELLFEKCLHLECCLEKYKKKRKPIDLDEDKSRKRGCDSFTSTESSESSE